MDSQHALNAKTGKWGDASPVKEIIAQISGLVKTLDYSSLTIDSYNMRRVGESTYEFFPGFEEWVNQKAELNLYRPWYKVLIFLSVTEESAFDLLFDYLEEYTGNKFEDIARF